VFNQFGDLERCARRLGERAQACRCALLGQSFAHLFPGGRGLAMPSVYACLEAEQVKYAIRLPAKQVHQDRIGYLLKRPVGRQSNEVRRFYVNFTYQAGSWTKPSARRW
jgi:hypothetical protein